MVTVVNISIGSITKVLLTYEEDVTEVENAIDSITSALYDVITSVFCDEYSICPSEIKIQPLYDYIEVDEQNKTAIIPFEMVFSEFQISDTITQDIIDILNKAII